MSEHAQAFIRYLSELEQHDRGALAHLRRGLGFAPGSFPRAYPYVERFVARDSHADDPRRKALYLTAGLFALHPRHQDSESLATAFGHVARHRDQAERDPSKHTVGSVEQRFIGLLGAEPESLPSLLRQAVSLLAADDRPCDYVRLLDDLSLWLKPFAVDGRNRICQRWARDFYRAYAPDSDATYQEPSAPNATPSAD
ncbi:type I-E CRISPR-associated protein Cse2/CasB [Allochromatium palmeri]|uniref:Type I-E CRISPR-associated protein Cse2/CasB n=1 Tax=Allochromatium palmeri TaxID=231048 RepID=A0A6N8EJ36_9GAMM|nr:type I-E CRISPR-associated protein Cse2/CasB [Allochromatium palmeri]MTW22939.1 type I-E CRISPR-associated protein Cse2/CasB [Allochromatium palmeri]